MDADWMDLLDEKNKEIERLQKQIRYQEHRSGRVGIHDPIFYEYGLSNYECALREIERLREQCEFEKKCRNDAFEELKQRDADIERLREALQFYASKNNYEKKKVWTKTLMIKNIAFPQYEPDGYKIVSQYHTPVLSDNGERARAALKEKE